MVLKVSIAGIRGDVNIGLTPEVILNMSLAYGSYMKRGTIVIGSDTRPTRDMVRSLVSSAVLATGCRLIDIGIAPTPVISYMVKHLKADGGIIISASHNDIEYNALKLLKKDGIYLDNEEGTEIYNMYVNKRFSLADHSHIKKIEYMHNASEIFCDNIINVMKEYINIEAIGKADLKIVIDAVNGAGATTNEIFFNKLGVKNVTYMNSNIDEIFPRSPEPVKENLRPVEEALKKIDFDIAFVQDPDADRLGVFSPERMFISEELSLPLSALGIYELVETPLVINIASSLYNDSVESIVKELKFNENNAEKGFKVIRTPVGEANVVAKMKTERSILGGEGNGGIIFSPFHYGRDSYIGMILVLNTIIRSGKSIDRILDLFPNFYLYKEKIPGVSLNEGTVKGLKETYYKGKYKFEDGIFYFEDEGNTKMWFLIRESNTEQVIRIQSESNNEKYAKQVMKRIREICLENK